MKAILPHVPALRLTSVNGRAYRASQDAQLQRGMMRSAQAWKPRRRYAFYICPDSRKLK
jgi:hypothetical protein